MAWSREGDHYFGGLGTRYAYASVPEITAVDD